MKQVIVQKNEAGQRLDKLLCKILKDAPMSFCYKMLRKKNITLNGKKATGKEHVMCGDRITFFLSEETFDHFMGSQHQEAIFRPIREAVRLRQRKEKIQIVYEDEDILIFDKPAGMLSQKANPQDLSAGEFLITYLLDTKKITYEQLNTFVPAVCNRLDRNTSGLLMAGKSLAGSQFLSEIIKKREVRKFYRCIVAGEVKKRNDMKGFLWKDETKNQVVVKKREFEGAKTIRTRYKSLWYRDGVTELEVELITGRPHQIRAHLASEGTPIIGDKKYGDEKINAEFQKKAGIQRQLLHSYRIEFPELSGQFSYLSGKKICGNLPKDFLYFEQ